MKSQDENRLQRKLDNNAKLLRAHEAKVKEYLKLRKRHRFKTIEELEAFLGRVNAVDGLEHSYAEKCKIIRDQIQIRKRLDGIKKIGNTVLHNCIGAAHPEPLDDLRAMFKIICTRESIHGISVPVQPELMQGRASKPGDDTLATTLLKQQQAQAAALTKAFYRLFCTF